MNWEGKTNLNRISLYNRTKFVMKIWTRYLSEALSDQTCFVPIYRAIRLELGPINPSRAKIHVSLVRDATISSSIAANQCGCLRADLKPCASEEEDDATKADRSGVVTRLTGYRGLNMSALERVTIVWDGRGYGVGIGGVGARDGVGEARGVGAGEGVREAGGIEPETVSARAVCVVDFPVPLLEVPYVKRHKPLREEHKMSMAMKQRWLVQKQFSERTQKM